jgi:8-oxo-dGTP diphosphatase
VVLWWDTRLKRSPSLRHASSHDHQDDLLVETDEVEQGVRHRAARLYRFDRRKYDRLAKQGLELSI